jgi:multidrug efflux pump subunit AcrA (membrane-fusion protein)
MLAALSLCVICGSRAMGQTAAATARIETMALRLIEPDPYQVSAVLEPARSVRLVAPIDGLIRSVDARLGGTVRESQDVVQFDPTEANARLRVAEAEVREKQSRANPVSQGTATLQAEVEAAAARVEVARAQLGRCSVRAPFAGRVLDVPVYPGQYVLKGTTLLELADTSSLRTILPVDRRIVSVGATITVSVEEQEVSGKVQAILPLPEAFAVLRELATPFAAAAVTFPNTKGALDAGLRARPAGVPTTAIANIPKRAVRPDEVRGAASSMVQVIRNEYVTNVPVQVLGGLGPDRVQVSGLFRNTDALIIGSSVPLIPGTLVRFNEGPAARGIEATSPNPAHGGLDAGITPPGGVPATSGRGASGSSYPGSSRRPGSTAPRSARTPTQSQTGGAPPF